VEGHSLFFFPCVVRALNTPLIHVSASSTFVIEPRFLVANHNYRERPVQLYWFDVDAMQKLVQRPGAVLVTSYRDVDDDNSNSNSNGKTNQVSSGEDSGTANGPNGPHQPVRPTLGSLQEFKVSPAVHAAYAFTWFSLSIAGLVMTRRLASAASGTTATAAAEAGAAASRGASASASAGTARAASAGGARRL
jgi:cytochrome oxidase assembly protein ShyY1